MAERTKVFISYSHDSPEHTQRVLDLADALQHGGLEVMLDQYVHPAPDEGWPRWMETRLNEANFILMVCTETYQCRVMGHEQPGQGPDVRWEGDLIYTRIYHDKPSGSRFIPVLLEGGEPAQVPSPVKEHIYYRISHFDLSDVGYEGLYRHLTGQAPTPPGEIGPIQTLPPHPRGVPPGLKLRHTLRGHTDSIGRIAWSPDGRSLASPSTDGTIQLWDPEAGGASRTLRKHNKSVNSVAWSPSGRMLAAGSCDRTISLWDVERGVCRRWLEGHLDEVTAVAWSPDGQFIASASDDGTIMLWEPETGKLRRTLQCSQGWVTSVAWSPDGQTLASASADHTIGLWDSESGELHRVLQGHSGRITSLAWSPDGKIIASTSIDSTVRLWDTESWVQVGILEGHYDTIRCAAFSPDGLLLASKSWDNTVRLWRSDTREPVANLDEPASGNWAAGLAFHPRDPVLATLGEMDCVIRIWDVNEGALLTCKRAAEAVHYSNAKIVLVGDSGVGKSGLGLVLVASPFRPTESTHGRHVWMFESRAVPLGDGRIETRETLLWDLAGQPGYRLVHQLHLNEVAVALIVFDAKSETDPFAGVKYWDRALRQAHRLQGGSTPLLKKFLVAARTDRAGVGVSTRRIDELNKELHVDGYFETSAKEGWNIRELAEAVRGAIDWEALPKISSTDLFQRIKGFLATEGESGRVLASVDDLFRALLKANGELVNAEQLRPQFETCIGLVEARGLIQRLSFGDLVLLQPELLDAYASAMVNAAKNEPDGLGSLAEEDARAGRFPMSEDERLADRAQERLLLIATIEDLLRHEIALLEYTDEGPRLVFPSQVTREHPGLSDPEGRAVVFGFEGPALSIYATLAVRLAHSGIFKKKELWQNAAAYEATDGGSCGLMLREVQEGAGELTLFFDPVASEVVRFQFEEYIHTHLRRRALPNTVRRQRVFACSACSTPVTDLQVSRRRARGFDWIGCGVCGERISLLDYEDRLRAAPVSKMAEMDRTADAKRNRDTSASILQGKIATRDFDVFLCHNTWDKPAVEEIGRRLKERGILPWLDVEQLQPGLPWQSALEKQIKKIRSAAVFVGGKGIGPWQDMELAAFLREFVSRKCPVIPVILLGSPRVPQLPVFLRGMIWVDFRKSEPEPMDQLVWGITGKRIGHGVR